MALCHEHYVLCLVPHVRLLSVWPLGLGFWSRECLARTVNVLYLLCLLMLSVLSMTVVMIMLTNIKFSSLNYDKCGLRLALKWASWDANLTIYTPLELSRLVKVSI